jgi:hypothetical protein
MSREGKRSTDVSDTGRICEIKRTIMSLPVKDTDSNRTSCRMIVVDEFNKNKIDMTERCIITCSVAILLTTRYKAVSRCESKRKLN